MNRRRRGADQGVRAWSGRLATAGPPDRLRRRHTESFVPPTLTSSRSGTRRSSSTCPQRSDPWVCSGRSTRRARLARPPSSATSTTTRCGATWEPVKPGATGRRSPSPNAPRQRARSHERPTEERVDRSQARIRAHIVEAELVLFGELSSARATQSGPASMESRYWNQHHCPDTKMTRSRSRLGGGPSPALRPEALQHAHPACRRALRVFRGVPRSPHKSPGPAAERQHPGPASQALQNPRVGRGVLGFRATPVRGGSLRVACARRRADSSGRAPRLPAGTGRWSLGRGRYEPFVATGFGVGESALVSV